MGIRALKPVLWIKKGLKKVFLITFHFLYPSFCLHCKVKIERVQSPLCQSCYSCIEWHPEEYLCTLCKRPLSGTKTVCCISCNKNPAYLKPHHSLFSCYGPLVDVFAFFKHHPSKDLARLFASFFILKIHELMWPLPDVIIPIFEPKIETFSKKNTPILWIAKELSLMIKIPLIDMFNDIDRVSVKKIARPLPEKNVLIVSAILQDSEMVYNAKRSLGSLFAKKVYSMALIEKRKSV